MQEPAPVFPPGTDFREQAKVLEERGRTRDAARLFERNEVYAEAARLFEAGKDFKAALRSAALGKDAATAKRLWQQLPMAEAATILERVSAYELLMELYVEKQQFDQVARLYERARQFDQAALAWERAGKLGQARKAYEKVKDGASADRVRKLEVDKLIERGDRLGAAVVLLAAQRRDEVLEVLKPLPTPKQYRFLEKLKLQSEADALAKSELAKAEAEKRPSVKARWLELLGDVKGAAQAWEEAERRDKAYLLYEKLGDFAKAANLAEQAGHRESAMALYRKAGDEASAARVAAMPEAPPPPPPAADPAADEDGTEG
jgi:tetratricopeptide (TPR) repeat protein